MRAFADILAQIEAQYLVRHIMVPVDELVCEYDETSARTALEQHPEYSIVPIRENGRLTAYVERGSTGPPQHIGLYRDVVGDGTSILRLLDIFRERKFSFVLADNAISGYVHFSDLNHRLVTLALFAVVSVYEYTLAEALFQSIDNLNYKSVLTEAQHERVEGLRWGNADLNWTTPLYFQEILALARNRGLISLDEIQIQLLNEMRNRICHATRLLVQKHEDITAISEAKWLWLNHLNNNSVLRQA